MAKLLVCPWLRAWHVAIFLAFWSFYIPPTLGLVFWHVDCCFLLCWFWYCSSNFPVCSLVDTSMLDLFSAATCSADFVLSVRWCFWFMQCSCYFLEVYDDNLFRYGGEVYWSFYRWFPCLWIVFWLLFIEFGKGVTIML